MKKPPFSLVNKFYSYSTIDNHLEIEQEKYHLLFQYSGNSELNINNKKIDLNEKCFLEIVSNEKIIIKKKSGICMLLSKDIINNSLINGYIRNGNINSDAYKVSKPWGSEYWITGESPINDVVLKYIKINKGTKTSVQVHMEKYESNFIVSGKAAFREGVEEYTIKKDYFLKESIIVEPTVMDVSPKTIHQVEALSDIDLIEASTNHLDDVIRLKDDSGRGDGKILSEHKSF